jgi:transcriptional antiterminator NusG
MTNKNAEWYVIQVVSWTEENVASSLFQRRESFWLEDYILDVFVPTHDVVSVRAWWVKVKKKKNILPGYILVHMVVTNESWFIVRNTPNVTWFLWAWNIPVPVSQKELDQLRGQVEQNMESFETKYKVWDRAIITKWPFEWNEWVIFEINTNKWVAKLNVNLLSRDIPVEIEFSQIKIK